MYAYIYVCMYIYIQLRDRVLDAERLEHQLKADEWAGLSFTKNKRNVDAGVGRTKAVIIEGGYTAK